MEKSLCCHITREICRFRAAMPVVMCAVDDVLGASIRSPEIARIFKSRSMASSLRRSPGFLGATDGFGWCRMSALDAARQTTT